jgi:hypothetical protein
MRRYAQIAMADDQKDPQLTEQTPKGLTVPIPKRKEFFENLKRAAEPKPDEKGSDTAQ